MSLKEVLLSESDDYCILDIETTTNLKAIRMVGVMDSDWNYTCISGKDAMAHWLSEHPDSTLITWNGARFDLRKIEELWGLEIRNPHIDGMLLAKMLHPSWPSYSLANVGRHYKLEEIKGEVDYDHATLSELAVYNKNDLRMTYGIFENLLKNQHIKKLPNAYVRAIRLENKVASLCQEQVDKGVYFDNELAFKVWRDICRRMEEIEKSTELPLVRIPDSQLKKPPKVQFKKDGTPSANLLKYLEANGFSAPLKQAHTKLWTTVGKGMFGDIIILSLPLTEPIFKIRRATFADASLLKEHLLGNGWEPTWWNTKKDGKRYVRTSPRLVDKETKEPCPNLLLMGEEWVEHLSEWLMLRARKNVLNSDKGTGWLPLSALTGGIIPSDADTLGTNTGRWAHRVVANIPRITTRYGKDFRMMFRSRPSTVWAGWDASSLEACMEAHYTYPYDPAYAEELMDGDIHTKNLSIIPPLRNRDHAKTFKYGITYGAQPPKVASILGVSKAEGEKWFNQFWDSTPALKELKADIDREASRNHGWIQALDGRMIQTRSPHSRLNAKFQSAGALVMKYAMLLANNMIHKEFGDEAYGLIRYHDEEVWECDTLEIAHAVGEIGCKSITYAGQYLKLNVPLTGEYKVGYNWAEVH